MPEAEPSLDERHANALRLLRAANERTRLMRSNAERMRREAAAARDAAAEQRRPGNR